MRVGVAGIGRMGAHMARNLMAAGHEVTVWNRSAGKARALAAETGCAVADTPGWPDNLQPAADDIDHDVTVCKPHDPIVARLRGFRLTSEQYCMPVDPSNEVPATTTFSGDHPWWIEGTVIPLVWKRRWDRGRVFYRSIGHELDDLRQPRVTDITRHGALWAAGGRRAA